MHPEWPAPLHAPLRALTELVCPFTLHISSLPFPSPLQAVTEPVPLRPPSLPPLQAVIELVRRRLSGQGDIGDMLADLKEPAEGGEVRGGAEGLGFGEAAEGER